MDDNTIVFAITQSGETADTLAALREMKRKGHPTLGICNVVGSTIAREADGGVYLHAGPEIGVASTKAFTSQCTVLAMLALYFGRMRHLSFSAGHADHRASCRSCPTRSARRCSATNRCSAIAEKYADCNNFLYLGRQFNFPTALEGALKLKEISYIHAEGYPAAEMKHGPIALVDRRHAQRVPHAARADLRQGDEQPRRDQGPRRPGDRRRLRRRPRGRPPGRRRDRGARPSTSFCSRSSP